jgi:ribonuclease D
MDSIYSYLDNVRVTVCHHHDDDQLNCWFVKNIIETNCNNVGFDTESKPTYKHDIDKSHLLSIIQICTPTDILICGVFNISVDKWHNRLINFLTDANISKYCVDSRQDEKLLNDLGIDVKGLVDIQLKYSSYERIGMKQLASNLLGLNISKTKNIQAGDWSRYPLSIKQIEYAASDAIVSLALA